ncbi:MAG TPA: class I SAM-dependent methyltransferase [Acidobacteriota bacterium]|nr:class I SAM-dependent methyltransferase [Acidobacteriota bacterium]
MNPFAYEFGYGWAWNYGHLAAIIPFTLLALLAWKLEWSRWLRALAVAGAAWGLAGLLIVQFVMRINLPMQLPTQSFLARGTGQVLDAGAGSGRSSLMVLLARPHSRVVALDLYEGYYGIADNTPQRLLANAEIAGARERISAQAGDMREMPFPDASFDAAVSAYAIDHLSREGVENSLSEVRRVLRSEGEFLLIVINPDIWIRMAYPFFVHHGYFGGRTDHQRWRSHLIDAGFQVTEMGTTPGSLYFLAHKPAASAPQGLASRR